MLSGSLAQSCSLARLTVHALLAHFRLLMSDLENLRHACARAQIFQVRQQDSKGIEHSMYRKTVLTHFEEKRQHPATYGAGPTLLVIPCAPSLGHPPACTYAQKVSLLIFFASPRAATSGCP